MIPSFGRERKSGANPEDVDQPVTNTPVEEPTKLSPSTEFPYDPQSSLTKAGVLWDDTGVFGLPKKLFEKLGKYDGTVDRLNRLYEELEQLERQKEVVKQGLTHVETEYWKTQKLERLKELEEQEELKRKDMKELKELTELKELKRQKEKEEIGLEEQKLMEELRLKGLEELEELKLKGLKELKAQIEKVHSEAEPWRLWELVTLEMGQFEMMERMEPIELITLVRRAVREHPENYERVISRGISLNRFKRPDDDEPFDLLGEIERELQIEKEQQKLAGLAALEELQGLLGGDHPEELTFPDIDLDRSGQFNDDEPFDEMNPPEPEDDKLCKDKDDLSPDDTNEKTPTEFYQVQDPPPETIDDDGQFRPRVPANVTSTTTLETLQMLLGSHRLDPVETDQFADGEPFEDKGDLPQGTNVEAPTEFNRAQDQPPETIDDDDLRPRVPTNVTSLTIQEIPQMPSGGHPLDEVNDEGQGQEQE
ncbi:MAG: hypothetical protein J3Q66DRAFT_385815 [Benniella sp.]|nr:MAG: hypothetical protein J3Q66DRAFT_385815 [Benniella sp.]